MLSNSTGECEDGSLRQFPKKHESPLDRGRDCQRAVIDITAWKLNMQAQFGSDKQQEEFNPVSDSVAMS